MPGSYRHQRLLAAILISLTINGVLMALIAQLGQATPVKEQRHIAVILQPTSRPVKPIPRLERAIPPPSPLLQPVTPAPPRKERMKPPEEQPVEPAPLPTLKETAEKFTVPEPERVAPTPTSPSRPPMVMESMVRPTPAPQGGGHDAPPTIRAASAPASDEPVRSDGGTLREGPGVSAARGDGEGGTMTAGHAGTSTGSVTPGGDGKGGTSAAGHTGTPSGSVMPGAGGQDGPGSSTGAAPQANNSSKGRKGAQVVTKAEPPYPRDARREGVEGTVVLRVSLDARARVTDVAVLESAGDQRLDRAAERGVKGWRFSAAQENGQPVASVLRVRVQFKLD